MLWPWIEISEGGRPTRDSHFEFNHPSQGQDHLEFAQQFVSDHFGEAHVADLDWERCVIEDE